MKVRPLTGVVCSECQVWVPRAIGLEIAGHLVNLCLETCVGELRRQLPRARGRRPLSHKARRVLSWMAQTPAQCGSLANIAAATGGYARNVVSSLLDRGMLEVVNESPDTARAVYRLTTVGVAAARGLEAVP